ncbi:hypothetical protein [Nocardia bovistercoris]|uniref:Serine-threonine protein kinase n=1 Tax=Nocardia bovistercoris TaxID=2785916 RepID=A0A931IDL5_9NOCA|nr:hypothetical protein [Nocardia bovistercoris]MBH0779231.1 hypothetical protein [Nocardia bovistercoris]
MPTDTKPIDYFVTDTGARVPRYALQFDADGISTSPLTQRALIDAVGAGEFTDVIAFCHGWNNDWDAANETYLRFLSVFHKMMHDGGYRFDREYRPALVGLYWPSAALEFSWEHGPDIAAADERANTPDTTLEFAPLVAEGDRAEFYRLTEPARIDETEGRRLIDMLVDVCATGDADLPADTARDADDILAAWAMIEAELAPRVSPGDPGGSANGGGPSPEAAGFLSALDPRKLLRMFTVYQMKDRAGTVGTVGVGPMLREMLEKSNSDTRFHVIGHSYGARVFLNAVSRPAGAPLPRPVDSMLLLQPAVNYLCFSADHPEGGYRGAGEFVRQPIVTTFSLEDRALRCFFHLALRRGKDLGDIGVAGADAPSDYAALGGYGPGGRVRVTWADIKDPGDLYPHVDTEVLSVNGSRTIHGHSEIFDPSTAWALFTLMNG